MLKLLKNLYVLQDGNAASAEILIADQKIAEISKNIDCEYENLETIDCGGMTAIPGYIDQHVHVTGGGGEGGFSNQVPPLRIADAIMGGVTTIVGLLGTDGTSRSVENLLAKTKGLREEGLSAYCLTGSYDYPSPTITGSVRKDIMLFDEIIGVKIAHSDHRSSGITKDEMIRLACEARTGGLLSGKPGVVHIHMGSGRDGLRMIMDIVKTTDIPVSVFRPTHLGRHLEQALEFANMGGYIDFTAGTEPERTAKLVADALRRAPKGLVTLSSDGNGSMPVWNEKKEMIGISAGRISTDHDTVKALVSKEGLSLTEAVSVLTENVARGLGLFPHKGVLQSGADADLLLLDKNLDIRMVMAGGRILLQDGALTFQPKFS